MAFTRIVLDHAVTAAQQTDQMGLGSGDKYKDAVGLGNYFSQLPSGTRSSASVTTQVGAVRATGAITFTGLPTATETCSIGYVSFEAVAGTPSAGQFQIGADATATAANLVTAINANSTLSNVIRASSASGVVTLTVLIPGKIGNNIALSESLSNATATPFSGGVDGTVYTADFT